MSQSTASRSLLFVQLEDAVVQSSRDVCVTNLAYGEEVEHLLVLEQLGLLELVDGQLAVVDRDEVDQLSVVLNIHVHGLDVSLVVENIFLDSRLCLEETLESGLAKSHLVELLLLVANLLLSLELLLDDSVTSVHGVHHAAHIEQLTLDPDPRLPEWILPRLDGLVNVGAQLGGRGVGHDPQGAVTIGIVVDSSLLELDESSVDALIVVVGVILSRGVLLEFLLLFLFSRIGIIYSD